MKKFDCTMPAGAGTPGVECTRRQALETGSGAAVQRLAEEPTVG